ncbi:hypothetical protein BO99DRAFT_92091 [Aspergillus violaceofuscus CBS 115571]|uniref:WW domain-containing protein n=1 Tax=Aspergillus violaceofuscus (strain CBS 115571) TaxID=1450538 RepID=A0A2V5IKE9_ASPV1|nr:hypothetical protein BO99DRAFT_92091 [Aspergillus violaceofuscus CBS 115571]
MPPPPPMPRVPEGWRPQFDDRYQEWYYVNLHTGQSQWERPERPAQPDGPAPPPNGPPPSYDATGAACWEDCFWARGSSIWSMILMARLLGILARGLILVRGRTMGSGEGDALMGCIAFFLLDRIMFVDRGSHYKDRFGVRDGIYELFL